MFVVVVGEQAFLFVLVQCKIPDLGFVFLFTEGVQPGKRMVLLASLIRDGDCVELGIDSYSFRLRMMKFGIFLGCFSATTIPMYLICNLQKLCSINHKAPRCREIAVVDLAVHRIMLELSGKNERIEWDDQLSRFPMDSSRHRKTVSQLYGGCKRDACHACILSPLLCSLKVLSVDDIEPLLRLCLAAIIGEEAHVARVKSKFLYHETKLYGKPGE